MKIAIVLGNRLNDDGSITDLMQKRIDLTLKVWRTLAPEKIIATGGIANKKAGISEASVMKAMLTAAGIPEDVILIEDKSDFTTENAKFSLPVIKSLGADEVILITSKEHMQRPWLNPVKIFKKQLKGTNIVLTPYTDYEI